MMQLSPFYALVNNIYDPLQGNGVITWLPFSLSLVSEAGYSCQKWSVQDSKLLSLDYNGHVRKWLSLLNSFPIPLALNPPR